jgi:lipopolysaccharide/colanic/teichoic acid biosynthesis glycosyltransferase
MRRRVDALVAALGLLVASPVLLATAIAIKVTSRGPVLYKQDRAGRSGHPFTMFKFRSMVDTEHTGPLVTESSDPRVTRLGALLRASKLDELPQLFNVLKGDMTLIGPRPEVPHFLRWYDPEELGILRVRPGLTGPGQIFYTEVQASEKRRSGDPERDYVEFQLHPKLSVDIDYLHRRSVSVDVNILFQTIAMFFGRPGGSARLATSAKACRCPSCSWRRQTSLSDSGATSVQVQLEQF